MRRKARGDEATSQPPGVIVLGMHRSGTSAATRLINMLGPAICTPNEMLRGPWNPSGHYESHSLVRLDNELLAEMGRTWWYPPPSGDAYFEVADRIATSKAKARRVFRRVHPTRPWVWKDPRACLLVPFWRAALGGGVVAVVVTRNPLEVADSLHRRHDVSLRFGVALWERYYRLVLDHTVGMRVLLCRYEDLITAPLHWSEQVSDFLRQAGFEVLSAPREDETADFIDPSKRHSTHARAQVAADAREVLATFDAIERLAGVHTPFLPPDLPAEGAWVEQELARVGPDGQLAWRPPPWAGRSKSAIGGSRPERTDSRAVHSRRRVLQRLARAGKVRQRLLSARRVRRRLSPTRWLRHRQSVARRIR
jgi:hypothetical protein